MKSELIVDVQPQEISIALTEDDRLQEVAREKRDQDNFAVGNIYYGRVKKVMPALNAVFVDVAVEQPVLHARDLHADFEQVGGDFLRVRFAQQPVVGKLLQLFEKGLLHGGGLLREEVGRLRSEMELFLHASEYIQNDMNHQAWNSPLPPCPICHENLPSHFSPPSPSVSRVVLSLFIRPPSAFPSAKRHFIHSCKFPPALLPRPSRTP